MKFALPKILSPRSPSGKKLWSPTSPSKIFMSSCSPTLVPPIDPSNPQRGIKDCSSTVATASTGCSSLSTCCDMSISSKETPSVDSSLEYKSRYGYHDDCPWGSFGMGDDESPQEVQEEDRRRVALQRSSMNHHYSSETRSPRRKNPKRPARRRRASIQFGSSGEVDDQSLCSSSRSLGGSLSSLSSLDGSERSRCRRQKATRRSSLAAVTTDSSCTQYGEEEPWMTFGHAKPYSAEELLAKHNVALPKEKSPNVGATVTTDDNKDNEDSQSTCDMPHISPEDIAKYDYGEAAPDNVPSTNIYGYGEAVPDSDKYEYGEAAPERHHREDGDEAIKQLYGYNDAASCKSSSIPFSSTMPQTTGYKGRREGTRRRSTIQHIGNQELDDFDPKSSRFSPRRQQKQRMRRSSVTGAISPKLKPKKYKEKATQYGEEPSWKVFGHVQPYSAEEYLAKFNLQVEDLPTSEEFSARESFRRCDTVCHAEPLQEANPESTNSGARTTKDGRSSTDCDASKLYGYEPTSPQFRRTPRRSSMKQGGCPRRASIQFGGEIEVSLPEGRKIKRRTSITFNERADVVCISPAKELAHDPSSLWVQTDEMQRIKTEVMLIAGNARNCHQEGKYCLRGLEKYIGSAKQVISERKEEAWSSVLDEQLLQRSSGEYDDMMISNVYKFATVDTQVDANARAYKDAKEIESYLMNTRRACRRMSM